MTLNNMINFSVSNVELIDSMNNSLFQKIRVKAFASGENSHTLPIKEDVLKRGAKTIYNKPILWRYNKYTDDAMAHEKDEVACGFVPEFEDNQIIFSKENGKTYITINALIWTRYCGRLIEIFKRDNLEKAVSIEIAYIGKDPEFGERPDVKDFVIAGITILGDFFEPACEGCKAELIEFSKDKADYLDSIDFAKNSIKINNTKDVAVDGSWTNPRRKLFNPIVKAPNKRALLKEAYLVGDYSSENPEITKFKYPHHVIKDGELVVHIRGLEAAFQRASQQNIVTGNVKAHLLRHYRELGLNTENFSEFNINKEQFDLYFSDLLSREESVGGSCMKNMKEEVMEKCDNKLIEESCEKKEDMSIAEEKSCKMDCDYEDDHKEHEDEKEIEKDDDIEELKKKIRELKDRIHELEHDNEVYMTKIKEMKDDEELKKFKEEALEEKRKEEEMRQMDKVMCDIENRGNNMTDEDKKELMSKIKDFPSIDAWANFAKAQVFDRVENMDGITRIGLPHSEKKFTGSIWDRL